MKKSHLENIILLFSQTRSSYNIILLKRIILYIQESIVSILFDNHCFI